MKKYVKRIAALAMALGLIFSMTLFAFAANASVNLNKKGSIFISAHDPDTDKPLHGGSFAIYKVADFKLIGDKYVFVPTAEFAPGGFDLSKYSSPSLAVDISEYIFENWISPQKTSKLSWGTASFTKLDCGLYMIEQVDDISGYFPINSFLVSLPMLIGDEYVYDINASPKMESLSPTNPGYRPPGNNYDTDNPNDRPPDDVPPEDPDNPPGINRPHDDPDYDEETPPDVVFVDPDEANIVDFEKADITLRLFSADYSPAMKISLAVLGVVALILIGILVYDKKAREKEKAE